MPATGVEHDLHDALPSATSDRERAFADLARWGYCVIAEALSVDTASEMRARLLEQAAGERAAGLAALDDGAGGRSGEGPNQRVFNLVNKGESFRALALHPLAREMMAHLLGPTFILSSLTANIAGPGGVEQPLHQDQTYVRNIPYPTPRIPLVSNIAWLLDDVSEANGGTRFVPGSHLLEDPYEAELQLVVAPEAPARSAIVFDGRVLHGTGANTTDAPRHVILSYYCQPFMRQQENIFLSIADDVLAACPDELKRLLGFEGWYSLGRVYDLRPAPEDGIYRRPEKALTALDAQGRGLPVNR